MNRRLSEQWLVAQNRVLEQFSSAQPLSAVMRSLAEGAERQLAGARCVIMLADEQGEKLRVVAAPSMSEAFREQMPALSVSEQHATCGMAAYLRQPVVTTDVRADACWANFREAAEAFGIRACWSTPMIGGDGHLLGTFALTYDHPREPMDGETQVVDTCTHLAVMIIERRRHERALRESEQRFRATADAAPVLIWMSGLDKKCFYFNKGWLAFTGRSMEEEVGDGWAEGVHAEDRERCLKVYTEAFARREPFRMDYRLRRADGEYRWVLDHGVPRRMSDGTFAGFIGTCVDITEQRRTEEELRESESRLRFTLDAARIGTWQWDIATGAVHWSDNLARIHGQKPEELTGQFEDFVQHVDPDHRERVLGEIRQAIEQQTTYETEYPTQFGPGKPGWMATRGKVVYGANHEPVRMNGVCMDITDRRVAEDRLRAHARQQETVAQLGQLALGGEDLQGLMDEIVRRVAETLDVPLTKLLELEPSGKQLRLCAGVGWQEGLVGEGRVGAELDSQAGYTLQSDRPVVVTDLASEQRFNGPQLLHDYGVVSGMSVVVPGLGGRPWGVFGVHTTVPREFTRDDINFLQSVAHLLAAAIQRKASERELQTLNETLEQRVADRTAVAEHRAVQLRALAAELAQAERRERRRLAKLLHDHLQQLLVAAKLRVGAIQGRLEEPELADAADQVDKLLEKSIEASRSLTVELSPPILYDAGLPAAIEWLCRWMNDQHGLTVQLDMAVVEDQRPLGSEVCVFLFDAVREMLFNVVKHAGVKEAMVRVTHQPPGPLRIEVEDCGSGFEAAALHASDVTAAGFGLFSIRERVQLFGGKLDLHSQRGEGTRITIELALGDDQSSPATIGDAPAGEGGSGGDSPTIPSADDAIVLPCIGPKDSTSSGDKTDDDSSERPRDRVRVLVVDDHAPLRKGLITLLSGHRDIEVVGEAVDGEMAVEAAQRLCPDVVLMDVHMPGINGIEATRQIAQLMPRVRVVGLSIEEHEEMGRAMRQAGAALYLPKGSPPAMLFDAIRQYTAVAE
ncbi:PAS domain-containing protein [Phycisphaerales bacterium AB-hyl4]|uniref:Oxygen sensor histidine kinase NreB n=1 Tax=Natronomicrosphaera hydrolytica TaxID=3242702 RepID=A0ABV4U538_9BACT